MKITNIKQQKRKNRFNIYVNEKFSFALSAEALVKTGLSVGQEISKRDIEILRHRDIESKLYNQALRFLSYRPRSKKEVKDYLNKRLAARTTRRRGRDIGNTDCADTINKIIRKLKQQDLINDEEFARWWIEQRQAFRPKGIYALKQELKQKGVSREIIDSLLITHYSLSNERASASKITEKKLDKLKKLSHREKKEKLSAFLLRRGFSYQTIKLVLDEILQKQ